MADRQAPLTKKSQVLAVIEAGGRVAQAARPGLYRLLNRAGQEVPAWQTAIKAAHAALTDQVKP
ncbi:MAG: hypothetical protein ACREPD_13020 [Stenotrophomonas sp.]|uniref:hypothetical protein n=1 Tax=Stenotrophomonas sp. TaxID=69392 RepID=UPI003D6C7BDC